MDYLFTFISTSIVGWILEYFITSQYKCDTLLKSLTNACLPLLTVYGLGGMTLLFITKNYHGSFISKVIISTIVLSLLECFIGKLSFKFNGYHTWEYDNKWLPICDGYVSIVSSIWWMVLVSIFFLILEIASIL